jgi:hypothetical protein
MGQVGDRTNLDAVLGEVLARPVSRDDLNVERLELPGEHGDPFAVRNREQGSHPGVLPFSGALTGGQVVEKGPAVAPSRVSSGV